MVSDSALEYRAGRLGPILLRTIFYEQVFLSYRKLIPISVFSLIEMSIPSHLGQRVGGYFLIIDLHLCPHSLQVHTKTYCIFLTISLPTSPINGIGGRNNIRFACVQQYQDILMCGNRVRKRVLCRGLEEFCGAVEQRIRSDKKIPKVFWYPD